MKTVVGELLVDPTELNCGCTDGSDSLVVADFDPSEVEGFQFNGQNLVKLSANDEFCACMTQVVGTFRCDLEQEGRLQTAPQYECSTNGLQNTCFTSNNRYWNRSITLAMVRTGTTAPAGSRVRYLLGIRRGGPDIVRRNSMRK